MKKALKTFRMLFILNNNIVTASTEKELYKTLKLVLHNLVTSGLKLENKNTYSYHQMLISFRTQLNSSKDTCC